MLIYLSEEDVIINTDHIVSIVPTDNSYEEIAASIEEREPKLKEGSIIYLINGQNISTKYKCEKLMSDVICKHG